MIPRLQEHYPWDSTLKLAPNGSVAQRIPPSGRCSHPREGSLHKKQQGRQQVFAAIPETIHARPGYLAGVFSSASFLTVSQVSSDINSVTKEGIASSLRTDATPSNQNTATAWYLQPVDLQSCIGSCQHELGSIDSIGCCRHCKNSAKLYCGGSTNQREGIRHAWIDGIVW